MKTHTKLFPQSSFTPPTWEALFLTVCNLGLKGRSIFPCDSGLTTLCINGPESSPFIVVHSYILPDMDETPVLKTHNELIARFNSILQPL